MSRDNGQQIAGATPRADLTAFLRLTMSSVQAISDATFTKLSFDTVSYSSLGWGGAPVAPVADITLPYAGLVLIEAHDLDWGDASNGVGIRQIGTRKNDSVASIRIGQSGPPALAASALKTVQSFSQIQSYAAGDTLQIYCKQSSSGSLNVAMNDLVLIYLAFGTFTFAGTN